jgi:hypothetical protein
MGLATYTRPRLGVFSLASNIKTYFKQIINLIKENTRQSQHKIMLQADKKKTRVEYRVGEKVWLYTPQLSTKTTI